MNKNFGRVVRVKKEQGYLFIDQENSHESDVFSHISDFIINEFPDVGDRLSFEIEYGEKGLVARNVLNLTKGHRPVDEELTCKLPISEAILEARRNASKNNHLGQRSKKKEVPDNTLDFTKKKNEVDALLKNKYHFYIVFNPLLNDMTIEKHQVETQAHSFYKLLKEKDYLFWGKLNTSSGHVKLNLDNFQRVVRSNTAMGVPTSLYISDFHNFWAAKVEAVYSELDKSLEGENTLEFYRKNWDKIELWFKITDMILVSTKATETNRYINQLSIKTSNDLNAMESFSRELAITPYTSGLRYPLIIENKRFDDFFSNRTSRNVDDFNLLFENSSESERVRQIVYSDVIPRPIFDMMPPVIRNEIIMAESDYSDPKVKSINDRYQKSEKIASDYLRILERAIKDLVFDKFYSKVAHQDFSIDKSGKLISFTGGESRETKCKHFSLGSLNFLVSFNLTKLRAHSSAFFQHLIEVQSILENHQLKVIRDSRVHLEPTESCIMLLEDVRRLVLGVGYPGLLNRLYYEFYKDELVVDLPLKKAA